MLTGARWVSGACQPVFFGPPPELPATTLTVIAAELFAALGSETSAETVAVFVMVVLPFTSTFT